MKPKYEVKLDKSKWKRQHFLGDNNTQNGSYVWDKIKDEIIATDDGWFANVAINPILFTIDLGATVKLSRYSYWMRTGGSPPWEYRHFNLKRWNLYGTNTPRFDIHDEAYWIAGGWKEDWAHLANCYTFKPSGENNPTTDEDVEYAARGFGFDIPLDAPPVRYVRFHVDETWGGGYGVNISEITFWGEEVETD